MFINEYHHFRGVQESCGYKYGWISLAEYLLYLFNNNIGYRYNRVYIYSVSVCEKEGGGIQEAVSVKGTSGR